MRRNFLDFFVPMAVYAAILIPSCQFLKTHPFLQNVGLPAVNWMYVGVSMFLLFGLGQILAWFRYR